MHPSARVVLVTSPHLHAQAAELLRAHFPQGTLLVWREGDVAARAAIRSQLLAGPWQLCISFYNDYIFSRQEIEALACVVNIHPALPCLRGRGYDVLPLLRGHAEHGVTLHFVTERIDAGEIVSVRSQPVPPGIGYAEFRARNQRLSLAMLETLLRSSRRIEPDRLHAHFSQQAAECGLQWSGEFVDSARLSAMLRAWRQREPGHPALRGLPPALWSAGLAGAETVGLAPD